MRLTIKNWSTFQHYKDRNPTWIKLHKSMLDDYKFHRLPVASRALAPCIWLLASEYENGIIDATEEEIAFRLRRTVEEIREGLEPLISEGFIESDQPASDLLAGCYQDAIPEKRREEKETEKNVDVLDAPLGEVWDYYLQKTGRNPKAYAFTPERRKKGLTRLKEFIEHCEGNTQAAVDAMKMAVDGLVADDWCMGRKYGSTKKYIDWIDNLFKSREEAEKRINFYLGETAVKQ